jgi:hypothetical protein
MSRVVIGYTTLPTRYDILIKSINSILSQTYKIDLIYLTIPKISTRLNKIYPPLPDYILSNCNIVRIKQDFGPISKLYGPLYNEYDPNTIIITCDDDVIFDKNHISTLIKHHKKFPNAVIGGTGALIGKGTALTSFVSNVEEYIPWNGIMGFEIDKIKGRNVDVLFGISSVLYTRKLFPENKDLIKNLFQYSLKDHIVFCLDDVLISGYLSKNKIKRKIFNDLPVIKHLKGNDPISSDMKQTMLRMGRSISKIKEYGLFNNLEPMYASETSMSRIGLTVVLSFVIFLACVYIFYFL